MKYAQVHVALAIAAGLNPQPNVTLSKQVIREKVGDLEREYTSSGSTMSFVPRISAAQTLLSQLFANGGGQMYVIRG